MKGSNNESKRITIAGTALVGMVILLTVFTVLVYQGKRNGVEDETASFYVGLLSEDTSVSDSDAEVSSEAASSDGAVSSAVESNVSSDSEIQKTGNEFIVSPDYKSEYYMVVFTGNQSVMVYKKNKSGEYSIKFHELKCSTGNPDSSPTKEGVYSLENKERWITLGDNRFGQYGVQITGSENYFISSTPFSKKKAWTMIDGEYENLGKAGTTGNIQMCVRDAHWVYENIPQGTQIHVVNAENPDAKKITLPKRTKNNGGWDPTDKWSKGNPYFE